tara:strand:- start:2063 stop:3043 length:981 start_codon:yes stop_codon:yes gene_type:complete
MNKQETKTIRWGIIGLGHIAHKFSKDLATIEGAELYAVASRNQEKATAFAEEFQVTKAYGSYDLLVKNPAIDAVYIATPNSFHKEHTILCLRHKKAVLCEKPFAMNLLEVKEMISIAKENNTLLMEALWTYFLPHFQYIINLIKNENFGKLLLLEADFGFQPVQNFNSRVLSKEVGGGSLLDIGIYPVFAALSTLGVPNTIESEAIFFENGVDSACNIVFNYNNAKAILKSTFLEETPSEAIFTCEKGIIKLQKRFHQPTSVILIQGEKEKRIDFNVQTFGYNFEIEHFNQLLRENKKESDIMTYSFSAKLITTLDKIRKQINLNY